MSDEFPSEWLVTVEHGSDTHDALCDVVLNDYGYTFVNDMLYEVVTWTDAGPRSWRWTLQRCAYVGRA
jgi:hypothetical protein